MKKQSLLSIIFVLAFSISNFSQTASFSMDVSVGCSPLCINFQDQSVNALSWFWDFGDASAPSTVQNPSHCYVASGNFTITLTATFASGTATATANNAVFPSPIAAFTTANTSTNTITFTDQSTGATSWSWNFGDLSFSSQHNPVHTYASSGNYTACLTAMSINGCTDTTCQTVMPTGIQDFNTETQWNIYPNPTQGQISILFDSQLKNREMLNVENLLGEIILQKEISGDATIDLSTQPSGIYFVRIGNSSTEKLVIE